VTEDMLPRRGSSLVVQVVVEVHSLQRFLPERILKDTDGVGQEVVLDPASQVAYFYFLLSSLAHSHHNCWDDVVVVRELNLGVHTPSCFQYFAGDSQDPFPFDSLPPSSVVDLKDSSVVRKSRKWKVSSADHGN